MNRKHALLMIACCLVPIAGFILVTIFNIPLTSVLYFVLILFCPLSHILMMKYMGNEHDQQHSKARDYAHHDRSTIKE